MMVWFIETYHDYLSKKEMLSFIFLDLSSSALVDLLHLILPIIPFLWLTRSHTLLLRNNSLMKYSLLHKIFMDLFGLVFWSQDISPLLYLGPVVHPQEFASHSFCPRALFLPAPCQYFSINASEQMSIFLLLNLYLLLASISGNIQERGTYLWWYELHIEHNGFHDYHAHPSDTIYVHSRISEGVQSSELCFWQHRTQSWLHVYCSTWLHYISQLLGWWNIV